MTGALWLAALLTAAAPAAAGEGSLFLGHYGTYVSYPSTLKVTAAQFGSDGIEAVSLAARAKPDDGYLILIFPKATRPKETLESLAKDILKDAAGEGARKEDFAREAGKGWRLLTQKRPRRMHFRLHEGAEYLYRVSGPDRAVVLELAKGIRQETRKAWEELVLETRKKQEGAEAFIPDLDPAPVYESPYGYKLRLPAGYAFHRREGKSEETLYLFPKKHGALLHPGILNDAGEYGNFGIVQLQAMRKPKDAPTPKRYLEYLKELGMSQHGLQDRDFKIAEGAAGRWTMDRARPSYLRYVLWQDERLTYQIVGGDRRFADALAGRVAR